MRAQRDEDIAVASTIRVKVALAVTKRGDEAGTVSVSVDFTLEDERGEFDKSNFAFEKYYQRMGIVPVAQWPIFLKSLRVSCIHQLLPASACAVLTWTLQEPLPITFRIARCPSACQLRFSPSPIHPTKHGPCSGTISNYDSRK